MKVTYFLFFSLLVLMACRQEEKVKAEIDRETFIDLLVDIHLADGYLNTQGYRMDVERGKIAEGYSFVLKKHNVTPKQFLATVKYYSKHANRYDEVYNKVIEKLTRLQPQPTNEKIPHEIKPGS